MRIYYLLTAVWVMTLVGCRKTLPFDDKATINIDAFHNRKMGASASELLDDNKYKSLVVEVQFVAGFKPQPGTIEYVRNFLETYLKKPGGINIILKEIPLIKKGALSKDEVLAIEKEKRSLFVQEEQIAIYILFTNGVHPGNKILGMAYRNTSAVVYGKAIRKLSSMAGRLTHQELETAVLLHEIGHLLGLVNKGSPPRSDHEDSEFHDHCNSKKCLMYYSVETKSLPSILLKGNLPVLDTRCIEDLMANGGKNTPDYEPIIRPF